MATWQDDLEMDDDGRLRKKRVAADGERFHFNMQMMDSAAGFSRTFADGSIDHTHWSRPGFRFADTNDTTRTAADQAYERMRSRLDYRHRQQDSGARTPTLDELEQAAQAAYQARSERMRTAWKTR